MVSPRFGFVPRRSLLHNLNPSLKFFILIAMMIGILIYPSWQFNIILLFLVFVGFAIARVPIRVNARRTRFLILFSLLMFIIQILMIPNGTYLLHLIPKIGEIGPLIPITDFGVEKGLAIVTRFLLIVFSSMLFVSVTDPTLLAHSLTRLRIPYRYCFALVIALRFLPLFDLENETVRMAQKSRGISVEVGSLSKILRSVRYTFFPLLVSALSRVDTLSMSMDGRGFGYQKQRTYIRESTWGLGDTIVFVFVMMFLFLCISLAFGYLPQISSIL